MTSAIDAPASQRPDWANGLVDDYKSGTRNVWLLHGNTHDYVEHPTASIRLRNFVSQTFQRVKPPGMTVVCYSPDEGITFPGPDLIATEARRHFDAVLSPSGPNESADDRLLNPTSTAAQSEPLPRDPVRAIPMLIDFAMKANPDGGNRRRAAVVIERMDLICPPADKAQIPPPERALLSMLHRCGTSSEINTGGSAVVLLAPSLEEVHMDLRLASSAIQPIEVPLPDYDQRLAFAQRSLAYHKVELDGLTVETLAAQAAGLNRRHIEDIVMRAKAQGQRLPLSLVKAIKAQQLSTEYAEVLSVLEPDVTFAQVGGHEAVKDYLREWVIGPMLDPELAAFAPMGVLFMGPSGTGKTYLVRALAQESGFNAVTLDADKIRGSYVGESERKLAKALRGIRALAPVIVFIDEIDQKVKRVVGGGGGGGDSVESNIFGKLLEFFSDTSHRGRILLAAATNRPDNMDATLKRPGRIDAKIPLLPPADPEERARVVWTLCERHGLNEMTDKTLQRVGRNTNNWTQAELEGLVIKALGFAKIKKLEPAEAFEAALKRMRRSTSDVELHTRLAVAESDDPDLVPSAYRSVVGREYKAPEKVEAAPVERGRAATADFGEE